MKQLSSWRSFQAAVAAKSTIVHEIKEMPQIPKVKTLIRRKNPPANPLGMIVKVKPRAKEAKMDLVQLGFIGFKPNSTLSLSSAFCRSCCYRNRRFDSSAEAKNEAVDPDNMRFSRSNVKIVLLHL
ncbi:hypothetical protein HAX54_046890 [Datura stramonium]|uniref:Uncharacterized protein n=1 Tax=Datura stramonium TaxID=4076 RepID=A0ABS8SRZ7_DATST|nr:hypothetical protein [Datura stramonium]